MAGRPGRKTKLTPEVQAKIVAIVRAGGYMSHAAAAAGVRRETVEDWMRWGEQEQREPYKTFAEAVRKAEADDIGEDLETIRSAAGKDWKAAAWKLERKYPKLFGSIRRMQIAGEDGGPIRTSSEAAQLSDEELEARVREVMGAETGDDGPESS